MPLAIVPLSLLMFLLGGCSPQTLSALGLLRSSGQGGDSYGTPIARATNGASSVFNMTTCAPTTERARIVEETIIQLNQQGVLALADGPGTQVRVTLNLCGQGPAPSATTARRP